MINRSETPPVVIELLQQAAVSLQLGHLQEAEQHLLRILDLCPDHAEACNQLGLLAANRGHYESAVRHFSHAAGHQPEQPMYEFNLGLALERSGQPDDALASYKRAIQLRPDFAEAYTNLSSVLRNMNHLVASLAACERAIEINPNLVEPHLIRSTTLRDLVRQDEAEQSMRHVLKLAPSYAEAHSNLLFLLAARAHLSPEMMLEEQRLWDHVHGQEGRLNRFPVRTYSKELNRRLRIGYVSPDFRNHPVSYFIEPLLEAHDRDRFEIFCYANHNKFLSDNFTERLQRLAGHGRFVQELKDSELAKLIYDDGIDILIDLAGHTAKNRLRAFTFRPAPVQATYLGFFAATGLREMDYWISDGVLHPNNTTELTVERIYRLPRCAFCYRPPIETKISHHRTGADGEVIFGSFSNYSKLTPEVIETWSELLRRLPGSKLMLMSGVMVETEARQQVKARFMNHGISAERLMIENTLPLPAYLDAYSNVDVALDPFPRTGGTTTAEALWMGVPVVTLAGRRYVERISASKLTAVDLEDLIACSRNDYLDKAMAIAGDHARRADMRSHLRERMLHSALCDGSGLARAMEDAYVSMWDDFLSRAGSAPTQGAIKNRDRVISHSPPHV